MPLYPCQQGLENPLAIYGLLPTTVNRGSLHDFQSLATASIAKHTQRCTYVLLEQQACCVRSLTTCYNITSGCKALWGEPEKALFVSVCAYTHAFACDSVLSPWFVRNRRRRAYLSSAGSTVSLSRWFLRNPCKGACLLSAVHWPLYFCRKHASWVVQPLVLLCSRQHA